MSEPTTSGIPQEIRERLDAEKKTGAKKLPPIVTESAAPANEDLPPPLTGEALENLVNENPQLGANMPAPVDPSAQVERYKGIINNQADQIKALKAELKEAKSGNKLEESRKFRILLALLEGFAARGDFSSDSLTKEGGGLQAVNRRLAERMQHATNLVSHAYAAIENLPEKHRF